MKALVLAGGLPQTELINKLKAKGIETVAQLSEKDQPTSVTIHRTESVPKPIDIVKLKRIVDEI